MFVTKLQTPFVTLFLDIDDKYEYVDEVVEIVEEILKQRLLGIKNEVGVYVTPTFPKLIYLLDENNNLTGGKYDYITKLAAKCSAKRMYPDYISAKKMREIYEGETFSCMGCISAEGIVTYKFFGKLIVESFEKLWNRFENYFEIKHQYEGLPHLYMDVNGIEIYDTKKGFVNVKRVIRNVSNKWVRVTMSGGRTVLCTTDHPFYTTNRGRVYAEDLTLEDKVICNYDQYSEETIYAIPDKAWIEGIKTVGEIPSDIFRWNKEARYAFLAGMIDGDGNISEKGIVQIYSNNMALSFEQVALAQSLGMPAYIYNVYHSNDGLKEIKYMVEFISDETLISYIQCKNKNDNYVLTTQREGGIKENQITKLEFIDKTDYSYDVTTESDFFEVNGMYSHNCRSFLSPWKDENGNYKWEGRFNAGRLLMPLI